MNKFLCYIFLPLGILASFANLAHAKGEFQVPVLSGPVMDLAQSLPEASALQARALIESFYRTGKAQIQILIVPELGDTPLEAATIKIVEQWKLGTEKKDNGVLFLVSIKDRRMRIEVGQGLEGDLPDVVCKRILADVVRPLFSAGQIGQGVVRGVQEIIRHIDPEFIAQPTGLEEEPQSGFSFLNLAIFFLIWLVLSWITKSPFWMLYLLLGSRGGGRSGGFGGGRWSGGGGGFSGGGASDRW